MKINYILAGTALLALSLASCREDEPIDPSRGTEVGGDETETVTGFYLLNEGNMGANKASLDYYDYGSGIYSRNIFSERNPAVALGLGDQGNDLKIYGGKLFAVIHGSGLVEVMDAATAEHIAAIAVAGCRYVAFDEGFAYVSSYAADQTGSTEGVGSVAKIDLSSATVVARCAVGYQPEELAVVDGRLYVANSGGYRSPNYDNTVSVIDLATFTETTKIEVAVNLHRLEADGAGNIYVSSRGDYDMVAAATYILDTQTESVRELAGLTVTDMTLVGDKIYAFGVTYDPATWAATNSYAVVDTATQTVVSEDFISSTDIVTPYGIAVNPENGDIFIADAGSYVLPGTLHCYSAEGAPKWSVTTGDIPSRIAFVTE
ncbi:MAG: YncE family protein [Rikenellaceae bacterium]|jgi:DNA-binding beta-propeller fold protein YncE|nr:YncE family protein [Rikenellaceae bacterium]